jgi:hypothetical protein
LINSLIDIGRLAVEEDLNLYIIRMETLFTGKVRMSVVTDLFKGIEGDMFVLFGAELNIRGNFSSDNNMFTCDKYFACNTTFAIPDDETINDTIGNDIGTFIGMSGRDYFTCK